MSVRRAKTQISLGIRPVWSESSLCAQWVAKDPRFLHADSEDSDQTGQMPRLIRVFAGRTVTSLVLSCRGSYPMQYKEQAVSKDVKHYQHFVSNNRTLIFYNLCKSIIFWQTDTWLFIMHLCTLYMQKKIVSFDKLCWPEILPPAPFDGLELIPERYYESPDFLLI